MSLSIQQKVFKIISCFIVLTFLFLYLSPTCAINAQELFKVTPEQIAEKVLADFNISDDDVDYSIVKLGNNQSGITTYNTVIEEDKDYAVRVDTVEGNQVKSDFYIPYIETEKGDLVNTLVLAAGKEILISNTDTSTTNGITVKITLYGTRFTLTSGITDITYYWRSVSSQAIWTGTGSGTISRIEVGVDIHGDLYNYNNSTGKLGSRISTDYRKISYSSPVTNPYQNNYYSSPILLSSGQALYLQPSPYYEMYGICNFTYKSSSGTTSSKKVVTVISRTT